MKIALVYPGHFPAERYGGTERVIWDLGSALQRLGHGVTLIATRVRECPFGPVIEVPDRKNLIMAVPSNCDIIHAHDPEAAAQPMKAAKPLVVTIHGNISGGPIHPNSVFVSRNHAERHGASCWVLNGLDWRRYPRPDLSAPRCGFHFLGKAAWSVKNMRGAIWLAGRSGRSINILGGRRVNFSMGFRVTLAPWARFHGMVDDAEKAVVLARSEGLVFPVLWHEPFGLAVIESLYMGCPLFATRYGALPELATHGLHGFLSNSRSELLDAMRNPGRHGQGMACHEHAATKFSADRMARDYVRVYERVLSGEALNSPGLRPATGWRRLPWLP